MIAEARLEEGRAISIKTRSELNQQAENLETEIRQLEERIYNEMKEASKVEEIIENSGEHSFLHSDHFILRSIRF